jgi:hypothetical protein
MSAQPKESYEIQKARAMLQNWAYWAASSREKTGYTSSVINRLYTPPLGSVYDPDYRGRVNVDALEAAHTNDLIMTLPREHQQAIYMHYLREGTLDKLIKQGRTTGIVNSRTNYFYRLDKAEQAFASLIT